MELSELRQDIEAYPHVAQEVTRDELLALLAVAEAASAYVTRSRQWAESKVAAAEVQVADDALAAELKRLEEV